MLEFIHRGPRAPKTVALFPGTWNPPTIAHVEIAQAALGQADEVVWVLPRTFPHKEFADAQFGDRCEMLKSLVREHAQFSAAVSEGGLYVDIAVEARAHFGPETEIALVLGRDAAERIATWDYGAPGVFDDLVGRHRLYVAARKGEYQPDQRHHGRISRLAMGASWDEVSSSEVRRRITHGEKWDHLVHPAILGIIEGVYAGNRETNSDRKSGREPRPDSGGSGRADPGAVEVPDRREPLVDRRDTRARDTSRGADPGPRRESAS